ncbi:MAG: aminotransferase class III-fold pyridoxal phosphate-dependent enzyme, partial [Silicimonas sp.]|nr:aminotransferase class III-fold pyridoxal phosphate-dependent enzyme [Silicimonas sp.]
GEMSKEDFGLACARELETAIEEHGAHRIAAFIGEPVQGAGGVIVPPETYWPEIQRICDKHGILLIADEVICGFGRTGNWFGFETLGIKPDMITIAKGLSSGYQPIGGSVVSDEIAEVLGRDDFNHGYTYSGHPVAAAVALENLRILEEEKIVDHVRDVAGPHLKAAWMQLEDHPLVGEASVCGMLASVALTPDKATRAAFRDGPGTAGLLGRDVAFEENLVMRGVYDRLVVSPPLIMTTEEIDIMMERVVKVLDGTLARLKAEDKYHPA